MLMYWTAIFLILATQLKDGSGMLYGEGCEEGWVSYGYYCYYFQDRETTFDTAWLACEGLGGDLASVWTAQERKFITDILWQPSVSATDFAWFGLHGTQDNSWAYLDQSTVIMTDGVLSSSSGVPADKKNRCGAFMGTGSLAFLDCKAMMAQGYICKKALPRVFATSSLLNHTIPSTTAPARAAQLYERVWPPTLLAFPTQTHYLAEDDTDSETGCAYRCFNVRGCMAFQVTCITSDMCRSLTCALLTHI
ncbi:regenerating islet-derived protein 3-beta-like [Pomacea canaliculata]|uniref:regenerating islet-derived protein 3-beta-like n=1 Tax=Pomacea canaliculata TaxID=400727 RepID=UPI000D737922|nr:regenerating islet-derived protein 3-beta-like [Pomacea canaliculata]